MTKRRFINSLAGLLVAACVAVGSVPLPTGFFKPASSSSSGPITSGLIAWWEADAITGLNDADPVTTWTDQSPSARNATQSTAGRKPTYRTSVFGSKPAVRFDGVDDYLTFTPESIPNFTVFLAWSAGGGSGAGNYWGPLSWRIWAGGQTGFYLPSGEALNYKPHLSLLVNVAESQNKVSGEAASGSRGKALDVWKWDGTTVTCRKNGVAASLSNGASGWGGAGPAGTASGIGSANYSYIASDFAAVLVYSNALSAADVAAVESYLNAKYSIY